MRQGASRETVALAFGSFASLASLVSLAALASVALFPSIAFAQVRAAVEPVTTAEIAEIRQAFQSIGLREADVVRADDGRIALTGEYENRDAVEMAFSAARAIVGLRRVAPTTPSNMSLPARCRSKTCLSAVNTSFSSRPSTSET